jgi:hypothetical protein
MHLREDILEKMYDVLQDFAAKHNKWNVDWLHEITSTLPTLDSKGLNVFTLRILILYWTASHVCHKT